MKITTRFTMKARTKTLDSPADRGRTVAPRPGTALSLLAIILSAPALFAAQAVVVPHVAGAYGWATILTAYNPSSSAQSFTYTAYSDEGQAGTPVSHTVPGLSTIELSTPGDLFTQGTGRISSSSALVFKLRYRYGSSLSVCDFLLSETLATGWFLPNPNVAWFSWLGVALVNPNNTAATVTLRAFKDGTVVGARTFTLPAQARVTNLSNELWGLGPADLDWIHLQSDLSLSAPIVISGSADQDRHLFAAGAPAALELPSGGGVPVLSALPETETAMASQSMSLVVPHVAGNLGWSTTLTAFNPAASATSFTYAPYSDSGEAGTAVTQSAPGLGWSALTTPTELSEQGSGRIETPGSPVCCLRYRYGSSQSVCDFVLSTAKATGWFLPNPKLDWFSWVGVALVNPNPSAATITLRAFKNGAVVGIRTLVLAAQARAVGLSTALWDLDPTELDWVHIQSDLSLSAPIVISGADDQDRHLFTAGTPAALTLPAGTGTPVISAMYPAITYAGSSAQTLTLRGSNFAVGATVKFNGVNRPATLVSATHLIAELTAEEQAAAGTFAVSVSNPAPSGGTSASKNFTLISLSLGETAISTPDWTAATHGKLKTAAITANLGTIFDNTQVQRLDITIDAANWAVMQSNLATLQAQLGGSPNFSMLDDPIYVPCEVFYKGKEWYRVGIRFKGNSSLFSANSNKLPLKLKFNEFEDIYPAIANQRFYGFKSLSLKSNFRDESEVHELVASQLFRDFGLAGPHCAFYQLYLNHGTGSIYYGLYTLVEEVDDTVIKTQYSSDNGNLYKPEDNAATFGAGTFETWELAKKTNESDLDYSDVQALYNALNSTLRVSDHATWKTNLESIFNVPVFLKWFAANQVMQNWDTYGVMTHNYYLYRNPSTQRLEWIPWDNNEALIANNRCLSLSASSVTSQWPLIRYLLDDPVYAAQYRQNVHDFASTLFNAARMVPIYTAQAALIQSAVTSEISGYTYTSSSKFNAAISTLKSQVASREAAALAY